MKGMMILKANDFLTTFAIDGKLREVGRMYLTLQERRTTRGAILKRSNPRP
jgi:hypothetical protein